MQFVFTGFVIIFLAGYQVCGEPTEAGAPSTEGSTTSTPSGPLSSISPEPGTAVCCPEGWFRYGESCYLYNRYDMRTTWTKAQLFCQQKGSNLFVPNNMEEWEAVTYQRSVYQLTWFGLSALGMDNGIDPSNVVDVSAELTDDQPTKWITGKNETGLQIQDLPWLDKAARHGKVPEKDCAAFYRPLLEENMYIHWYMCSTKREFICEKNSTLTKMQEIRILDPVALEDH